MGLDGVELVMAIEDEFGITIPDSDYAELRTVGNMVDYCLDRIQAAKTKRCPNFEAFFAIRRLVRDVRHDSELRIRPRDNVDTVLDVAERKRFWQRLPILLQTYPRPLRRPPWLRQTLVGLVLCFPIVLLTVFPWLAETLFLIAVATVTLGIILYRFTIGLRSQTPEGFTTFGDITKRIVGLTVATNPPAKTDYETVFSMIKEIIIDTLGVDDDEVVPAARFIEDLGVS